MLERREPCYFLLLDQERREHRFARLLLHRSVANLDARIAYKPYVLFRRSVASVGARIANEPYLLLH